MDNYEINILRRDGNWKKVKPNDLIMDSIETVSYTHLTLPTTPYV